MLALRRRQIGHEAGDLAGQFGADVFVVVLGKIAVGAGMRRGIGGDRAPRRRCAVLRQIVQHVRPRIGAASQFMLCGLGTLLQQRENLFARQFGFRSGLLRVLWHRDLFCPEPIVGPGPFRRA